MKFDRSYPAITMGIAVFVFSFAAPVTRAEEPRVVYPKSAKLEFSGTTIDGELKNPAEFYFQVKPQEKFGGLIQKRKNFHREMIRDAVSMK
jgi:hypothetical protein